MKERQKTLPPKLKLIAETISEAMNEARKIGEVAVAEEVLIQLEKVTSTLEQAKKEIARVMRLEK